MTSPSIVPGRSAADVAALLGDWPARGSGSLAARLAAAWAETTPTRVIA